MDRYEYDRVHELGLSHTARLVSLYREDEGCYDHFLLDGGSEQWTTLGVFRGQASVGTPSLPTRRRGVALTIQQNSAGPVVQPVAHRARAWAVTADGDGNLYVNEQANHLSEGSNEQSVYLTETARLILHPERCVIVDTDAGRTWTPRDLLNAMLGFRSCPAVATQDLDRPGNRLVRSFEFRTLDRLLEHEPQIMRWIASFLRNAPHEEPEAAKALRSVSKTIAAAFRRYFRVRYRLQATPQELKLFTAATPQRSNIVDVVVDVVPTVLGTGSTLDVRDFSDNLVNSVLRGMRSVLLRGIHPGGSSEIGFLDGLSLPRLMLHVACIVSVYGLRARPGDLQVPADLHAALDSLIVSHVSVDLTDTQWCLGMWTALLRNVQRTLVWDVYTRSNVSDAPWQAFLNAVRAAPYVPEYMELTVFSSAQLFTDIVTALLRRTRGLSVRLDGRSRHNLTSAPVSVCMPSPPLDINPEDAVRLEMGVDLGSLASTPTHLHRFVAYVAGFPGVALRLYINDEPHVGYQNHPLLQQLVSTTDARMILRELVIIHNEGTQNDSTTHDTLIDLIENMRDNLNSAGHRCDRLEYRLFSNNPRARSAQLDGDRGCLTVCTYWALPAVHHWADPQPWRNPFIQAFYSQRPET